MEALLAARASDYSSELISFIRPDVTDEADWIARAQRSDARAFESLYRLHVDKVYGLCLRMTGNVAEAEDCAQEAFIQAWNKLERFRGDSAFGTWLHRIAVNAGPSAANGKMMSLKVRATFGKQANMPTHTKKLYG